MTTRTKVVGLVVALLAVVVLAVTAVRILGDDRTLSNGCSYTERGLPECGTFVGAAIGANDDPARLEDSIGGRLAIRRTYWQQHQVDLAVDAARDDVEAGRLPWISFKLGVPWPEAAEGAVDEWTEDLRTRLEELPGPVWVAIHHEPENDGDISQWRAIQSRLGPILRESPNVGFTVVLTGWNQIHGPAEFSLDRIWPDTKVDVAAFDVYNRYGPREDGSFSDEPTDLRSEYFSTISMWAQERDIAWAVGETGLTDQAATIDPGWLETTFNDLEDTGGIALIYFDSENFINRPIGLSTPQKREAFSRILAESPLLPVPD